MSALAELTLEDEIVADLAREFPLHARLLDDARLLEVARRARRAARSHGLESAYAATCFARLSVMLGAAFDQDPLLPWAGEILRDAPKSKGGDATNRSPAEPDEKATGPLAQSVDSRVDRLYDAAHGHLHEIAADFPPGCGPAAPTLERLRTLSAGQTPRERVAAWIAAALPARCEHLGPSGGDELAALAAGEARRFGLGEPGVHVVALLMAAFGVGFAADPALPWPAGVAAEADCQAWLTALTAALTPWAS